jgi:hypothetical protein
MSVEVCAQADACALHIKALSEKGTELADEVSSLQADVRKLREALIHAEIKVRRQHAASVHYALLEKPRVIPNVPTTMEVSLSHFLDTADAIRDALAPPRNHANCAPQQNSLTSESGENG